MIQRPSLWGRGRSVTAWCCIGLTALIVTGCASLDQKGEEPAEKLPRAPHDLVDWEARGRASFTYQGVTEAALLTELRKLNDDHRVSLLLGRDNADV